MLLLLVIVSAAVSPVWSDADAAHQVYLCSTDPQPCYMDTIDLICHYPDVLNNANVYADQQANWKWNKERVYPDGSVFQRMAINKTASRLRVRIDPAKFFGDPVSFTCYRVRNNTAGVIVSATMWVDPQDVAKPPILAEPMVNGRSATILWNHTDKGLCFRNLTFSYDITLYSVKDGKNQSNRTRPGATEYIINNLMPNSDYRVDLVGFTSSEPPVYSVIAVVNFTTEGDVSNGPESELVKVGVSAVVVVAVVVVMAMVVLILCRKLPCCKRVMNSNCLQDCTKRKKVSSGQGDPHERLDLSSRPSYPLGSATIDTTGKTSELKVNDIEERPTMGKTKEPMGGEQPTAYQQYTEMDDTDNEEVPITVPLQEKGLQNVDSDEVVEPLLPQAAETEDEILYDAQEESTKV